MQENKTPLSTKELQGIMKGISAKLQETGDIAPTPKPTIEEAVEEMKKKWE